MITVDNLQALLIKLGYKQIGQQYTVLDSYRVSDRTCAAR